MKFSLLRNLKMPTIVGIFVFISRENIMLSYVCIARKHVIVSNLRFISGTNFMLSWVEHEKSFIIPGPVSCFLELHMGKQFHSCRVAKFWSLLKSFTTLIIRCKIYALVLNTYWKEMTFSTFPLCKSTETQIWPYRKKVKAQTTIIIWTNLVELEIAMLTTKIQPQRFLDSGEEDLKKFLPY